MEKAFKLDFVNDKTGSLYVNCCGMLPDGTAAQLRTGLQATLPDPLCPEW